MNTVKDGYIRIIHDDCVLWRLDNDNDDSGFVIARFPFVPDYHLCDWVEDYYNPSERPLQQFKTLTQALAVLRVIEGSQS